jgi:carboxyl-terminal processing protease
LIVGDDATHGKGTVQSLLDLGRQLFQRFDNAPSLGAIKITMQQFYRPSGASTQLEGVKSDVVLPSITTHLPVGEGDLDHAIAFDRVPPARYTPEGSVQWLRQRSAERVKANEKFAKVDGDIARYKRRKEEKTISLNEGEFARQWNEGKAAEEEEEKRLEESEFAKRPVVKRDYYFDEAMNVAIDYLTALAGKSDGTESAQATPVRSPVIP